MLNTEFADIVLPAGFPSRTQLGYFWRWPSCRFGFPRFGMTFEYFAASDCMIGLFNAKMLAQHHGKWHWINF